jgi:hypothetical protein
MFFRNRVGSVFPSEKPLLFLSKTVVPLKGTYSFLLAFLKVLHRQSAWDGPSWQSADVWFKDLVADARWLAFEMLLLCLYLYVVVEHFTQVKALLGTGERLNLRREVLVSRRQTWSWIQNPRTAAPGQGILFLEDVMRSNVSFAGTVNKFGLKGFLLFCFRPRT